MDDKLPPWTVCPHIPYMSIGWRMGSGEDYWHEYGGWYATLTADQRAAYRKRHPEPPSWTGFYAVKEERIALRLSRDQDG